MLQNEKYLIFSPFDDYLAVCRFFLACHVKQIKTDNLNDSSLKVFFLEVLIQLK